MTLPSSRCRYHRCCLHPPTPATLPDLPAVFPVGRISGGAAFPDEAADPGAAPRGLHSPASCAQLLHHRLTERLGVEGTLQLTPFPPPDKGRNTFYAPRLLQAWSWTLPGMLHRCHRAQTAPGCPFQITDEFIKGLKVSFPSLLNALIYARV